MVSRRTRLTFVTPGVLLRQLMVDPQLEDVSHVVIDEVHERNINTGGWSATNRKWNIKPVCTKHKHALHGHACP
jgi:hypothetical protein